MSLLRLVLRKAAPLPAIGDFSRYLFIGPHPDDIEIGCGATVSRLVSMGKEVSFLICLDGRYGLDNAPAGTSPDTLAELRKAEAIASANSLGVSDIHFLELPDGGFYSSEELRNGIALRIGIFRPDVVFTVDPTVETECHVDHLNVGHTVMQVAQFASNRQIMALYGAEGADIKALALFMTARPNRYFRTRGHVQKQLDAIFKHHLTQFPTGCPTAGSIAMYIKLKAFFYGIRSFKGQAEGFRVLDPLHMHCFPEA